MKSETKASDCKRPKQLRNSGFATSYYLRFFPLIVLTFVAVASAKQLEVVEPLSWYADKIATDATSAASPLGEPVRDRLDVRGAGDTAWAYGATPSNGRPLPPPAKFDEAIDAVDPSGALFGGDLNFLNWESVVGERCDSIRSSVDFYFLSHPDSIRQAIGKGFNLFSLANNHAQDCNLGRTVLGGPSVPGPKMTAENFERITKESSRPFNWAGVTAPATGEDPFTVRVVPFQIGGRSVRVAIGAVAALPWNIPSAATILTNGAPTEEAKIDLLVSRFRAAPADFRILSIHTQDSSGNGRPEGPAFKLLKHISERFIREGSGDVVFGEGPHTWGGVKVIPSTNGKRGVIFTSLGNFIHGGLRTDSDNYLARALFDRKTLRLREVQVHPFKSMQNSIELYSKASDTKEPNANFRWDVIASKVNGMTAVGYSARFQ